MLFSSVFLPARLAVLALAFTPALIGQSQLQSHNPASLSHELIAPTLFYIMNAKGIAADGGAVDGLPQSSLGIFNDSDVVAYRPGFDASAFKVHASTEFNALVGDADYDGHFGQIQGGDIDALGLRRPGFGAERVQTERLVFSVENAWGTANPPLQQDYAGALDGSLFSLGRHNDGTFKINFFLRESVLVNALGQPPAAPEVDTPMVDIDAFTQDFDGNVYLSFRHDEVVGGTLLSDDGVVCLPRSELQLDWNGNINQITPNSAVIVLDKPAVNALLQNAALVTPSGNTIKSLVDLQALALDPHGGTFTPVNPVPGLPDGVPHLFFNGQSLGATVLTTRDGGSMAEINGLTLGSSPASGAALGLDPDSSMGATSDLNGLLVAATDRIPLIVEVESLTVEHDGQLGFVLGNFKPLSWAWIKATAVFPAWGDSITALPSETDSPYPWLLVPEPSVQWAVAIDQNGRARLQIPLAITPDVNFWVLFQAYEVGSGELSTPASIWCPWP
ncbi:MAG: hypothetical protein ACI9EF_002811 [Pseudohongiellaceae bacterium]|jgi:hypothetical protein